MMKSWSKSVSPVRALLVMAVLLLVAPLLATCHSGSPGPLHHFAGKLLLIQIPSPYLLPGAITLGADGNVWFPEIAYANFGTAQPGGALGRLSPSGALQAIPLPSLNSYPLWITPGADGDIWFTATQGQGKVGQGGDTLPGFSRTQLEIGRVTPAGKFKYFPLPADVIFPDSIVSGPDGSLWFGEEVPQPPGNPVTRIGRVTVSGAFREFALPAGVDAVYGMTGGPDGNLWMDVGYTAPGSLNGQGKLARMTPQGSVTLFATPQNGYSRCITSGPDGNLWFALGDSIGRITPGGAMSTWALTGGKNTSFLGAYCIATGADGALWFVTDANWIGRIAPSGAMQKYPLTTASPFVPFGSLPKGSEVEMISGMDGTFWITAGTQIGYVV